MFFGGEDTRRARIRVLLTPRFSGVAYERRWANNGFNRFALVETVETVLTFARIAPTPLKRGVNETGTAGQISPFWRRLTSFFTEAEMRCLARYTWATVTPRVLATSFTGHCLST